MQRIIHLTPILLFVVILTLAGVTPGLHAFELRIENDKLNVKADRVPLRELLQRLSDYGITIRIDPAINPSTSASFQDKELQEGLKSILKPLNFIFIWKPDKDDTRPLAIQHYRLNEIQIFKPGKKDRMIYLEEEPDIAAAQTAQTKSDKIGPLETPVVIKANRVFVPVVVVYGDRKVETSLIFDTGAGSIVLHQDVADSLGILETIDAKGRGVGGIEIDAKVARLQSVKVGPYEKSDLRVAIVEYKGDPDDGYHGLLGMNFLRGLKYEIDFDRQVIIWGDEHGDLP